MNVYVFYMSRSVEGVLLVHQHKHPHVLLLQQTLGLCTCEMIHSCVCSDSSVRDMTHFSLCDMTHTCVIAAAAAEHRCVHMGHDLFKFVT